jgi:hypothetical protein
MAAGCQVVDPRPSLYTAGMGDKGHICSAITCIAMLAILILGGCNPAPAGEMPTGWPIAELTLPDSAMIDLGEKGIKTEDSGEKAWTVGINDTMSWVSLNKHVVKCLKPLGYSEYYAIKNGTDKRDKICIYVSGDKLTEVWLWNLSAMGAPADKPDSTLTIRVRNSPSQDVLDAGKTVDGFQHVLEPL